MHRLAPLIGVLLLFPAVAQAQPGIWFTLGDVVAETPPNPMLAPGNNAASHGRVFRMQRDSEPLVFPGGTSLVYDIREGAYGRGAAPADTTNLYPADGGEAFRIYLVHFDHADDGHYQGAVVFDEPIVAVIAAGVVHQQFEVENPMRRSYDLRGGTERGLELYDTPDGDFIERTIDGFSVKFDLFTNGDSDRIDMFRVITRDPRVDAEVRLNCPDDITAIDGIATLSGGFENRGSELSPPVLLRISNDGAADTMGDLRLDGTVVECEPFRGDTLCPLGRVPADSVHRLRGELMAPPGVTLNISFELLGSGREACSIVVTFPPDVTPGLDAGPGPDAGAGLDGSVSPPPNPSSGPFFGGGGARCSASKSRGTPWALLVFVFIGAAFSWRRR